MNECCLYVEVVVVVVLVVVFGGGDDGGGGCGGSSCGHINKLWLDQEEDEGKEFRRFDMNY